MYDYILLFNVIFIMNVHLLIGFYVPFMMLKCTTRNIYSRYYILLSLMPGWAPESTLCTPRHSCSALCSAALVLAKISSQQQFLCIHLSTNLLQLTEPHYYYEHVCQIPSRCIGASKNTPFFLGISASAVKAQFPFPYNRASH